MKTILLILVLALSLLAAGGCGTSPANAALGAEAGELALRADQYDEAFNAAVDQLRDLGFLLERVDAQQGVILTRPKVSVGIAAPWDPTQSTIGQEFEDVVHRHRRQVRITFVSPEGETQAAAEEHGAVAAPAARVVEDLIRPEGPSVMRVRAVILRVYRPGSKPDSTALSRSTAWWDPELATRGLQPEFTVPLRADPDLESRLARLIAGRLRP